MPVPGQFYVHGKTGRVYKVIEVGTFKGEGALDSSPIVIYTPQSESGTPWYARPLDEFTQKFTRLS